MNSVGKILSLIEDSIVKFQKLKLEFCSYCIECTQRRGSSCELGCEGEHWLCDEKSWQA